MKNDHILKFKTYYDECLRHLNILEKDYERIRSLIPLSKDAIKSLINDEEMLMILDQIAYRFIKFQDKLGKLLKNYFFLDLDTTDKTYC